MNLYEAFKYGEEYLTQHAIEDASVDAWLLLEYVTGVNRTSYLVGRQAPLNDEAFERYRLLLDKRGSHIPLQHLTGEQEFMGFSFLVNEHVLIPRQDTETLVEEALKYLRPGMKVLDLCTGSGCIAISLMKLSREYMTKHLVKTSDALSELYAENDCDDSPMLCLDASDISAEALEIARSNAKRLDAKVRFIQSDLFEGLDGSYDVIVSNPPYIRTAVIEWLSEEVRLHEPYMALDGREDGLHFYHRIVNESRTHLSPGGVLLFEIGYDQGESVSQLLADAGFTKICVLKDLAGLDRVVRGRIGGME